MLKKPTRLLTWLFISTSLILFSCNTKVEHAGKKVSTIVDTLISKEKINPYTTYDKSPLDISYYPSSYPVLKMNGTDSGNLACRVIYSRPQKKGRMIFGNTENCLCIYGREWRLGANEATEIEFFKQVNINGQAVNKGRYVIYCIPFPDKWTIVFNSNLFTWGLHMDRSKDILQTDIPVTTQNPALEDFTMVFEDSPSGAGLIMAWDNVKAVLPISFTK